MEDRSTKQACKNLHEKLHKVSEEESECTIYKVHRHLREVNPKAYEPEILAIGPYHRGKDELKMMEDHKLRYFNILLQRTHKTVENFVWTIAPLESRACKSYVEPISLERAEFIEMLILDGCFIIEYALKCCKPDQFPQENDPILDLPWISNSLERDLMLFENQIPFFILCKLYDLIIEGPNQHRELTNRLQRIFDPMYPIAGRVSPDVRSNEIKHLLDLIYVSWRPAHLWSPSGKRMQFIKSATRLEEANVKFKKSQEEEVNLFELKFENGTIHMPPLIIDDRTDSLFRNLIAYEQYLAKSPNVISYMRDYAIFLDRLVDSSKDVEILCHKEIIQNWLGDEEVVAKMVNKLGDSVSGPGDGFIYTEIFESVEAHCRKRRNAWMANLRRNYLNGPWAIISIVVAIVLLLLSITQALFTILQVV